MDLPFVDENDFQKRGKWFFWSDNSSWETSSTISMETNESLADVSELNGERESKTNSEGDSSLHDDGDVSNQQSDVFGHECPFLSVWCGCNFWLL